MTHWYVTTGVSLLRNSRCWTFDDEELNKRVRAWDSLAEGQILGDSENYVDWGILKDERDTLLRLSDSGGARQKTIDEIVAQRYRTACWSRQGYHALPAELATLYGLSTHIQPSDHVHLIAGKSNEDVAAFLMEMLLRQQQDDTNPFPLNVSVEVAGPYELDPVETGRFAQGIDKLWNDLAPHLGTAKFVLTGGYKGVLIALALRLGSHPNTIPLFYAHEEKTNKVVEITLEAPSETAAKVREVERKIVSRVWPEQFGI